MRTTSWIAILAVGTAAVFPAAQAQAPAPPVQDKPPIPAQTIPEAEKNAIIETALDYGDGFYSGAPERVERALHPDLNKVYVATIPPTGGQVLSYSTYSGLIEMTRAKVGLLDPEKRKTAGTALRLDGEVACAKLTSAQFNDFLQMVKVDGQWRIVNVLWVPGPDAPNRPQMSVPAPGAGDSAIIGVARDFLEGILSGDATRVAAAVHPEVSRAAILRLPTGKIAINRTGYSGMIESARAKLTVVPEAARKADYQIVDVMDGMAFVEIAAADALHYVQMTTFDGRWKIVNILSRRNAPPAPPQR